MKNPSERIKDPEAIVLPAGYVLLELIKGESRIISPDLDNPHNIDHIRICKIGKDVNPIYEVGDIVLDAAKFNSVNFETKGRVFSKTMGSNLKLVVKADNFEPNQEEEVKINLNIKN